jgi:hypothetical protein
MAVRPSAQNPACPIKGTALRPRVVRFDLSRSCIIGFGPLAFPMRAARYAGHLAGDLAVPRQGPSPHAWGATTRSPGRARDHACPYELEARSPEGHRDATLPFPARFNPGSCACQTARSGYKSVTAIRTIQIARENDIAAKHAAAMKQMWARNAHEHGEMRAFSSCGSSGGKPTPFIVWTFSIHSHSRGLG